MSDPSYGTQVDEARGFDPLTFQVQLPLWSVAGEDGGVYAVVVGLEAAVKWCGEHARGLWNEDRDAAPWFEWTIIRNDHLPYEVIVACRERPVVDDDREWGRWTLTRMRLGNPGEPLFVVDRSEP